jgi:hypothetical protein
MRKAMESGPKLTADGMKDFDRIGRLRDLVALLRARLPDNLFRPIYRLHDHEGILSAGVRVEKDHFTSEQIEKAIYTAWEDLNEGVVDVYFDPPWGR